MARKRARIMKTSAALCAIVFTGILISSARGEDESENQPRIMKGLAIAPVPLNLAGKNQTLVGWGSYLVNAAGGCNDCHTNPPYAAGRDPFQGQPKQVNAAGYLAGGIVFFDPVISRNLTPDKTGKPAGRTFEQFHSIMRTGIDPSHAHPQLGPFLQVMPWPVYQELTSVDLRAIYEYLSAIPCVEGDPGLPSPRPIGTRCR